MVKSVGTTVKTSIEREAYINDRKKPANYTFKLWALDTWMNFDVYTVPVDGLLLNVDNRRFRAERMWAENKLGHSLDPENNPDDERSIESLLLDSSHKLDGTQVVGTPSGDYEALREDWQRRRQESPFWIRPNGIVRNGNRRLAMIKRMQREGGDVGLQYVDAIILKESEIDEAALLEMEQKEQITENFKVRYKDIDYLLAIQEAAKHRGIDWFDADSIEQISGELQGMTEKSAGEVMRDLYAIKYMDQFLEDSGQPNQYQRLLRTLERFRDIGRMMMRVEREYPRDVDRVLQVLFAAVRAGVPYGDIRTIRAMFRDDRERFDGLAGAIEDAEAEWSEAGAPGAISEPVVIGDAEPGDDDDGRDENDGPGPDVEEYPQDAVADVISDALDAFESSKEDDSYRIVREILNRMQALDEHDRLPRALRDPESADDLRGGLIEVFAWVDGHRGLLEVGE
jgi:hypothetical protein